MGFTSNDSADGLQVNSSVGSSLRAGTIATEPRCAQTVAPLARVAVNHVCPTTVRCKEVEARVRRALQEKSSARTVRGVWSGVYASDESTAIARQGESDRY